MATVKAKKTAGAEKASKAATVKKTTVKADSKKQNYDLIAEVQQYFGFDGFKDEQEAIIKNLLYGFDTFVIMPTGGGKSFVTSCLH